MRPKVKACHLWPKPHDQGPVSLLPRPMHHACRPHARTQAESSFSPASSFSLCIPSGLMWFMAPEHVAESPTSSARRQFSHSTPASKSSFPRHLRAAPFHAASDLGSELSATDLSPLICFWLCCFPIRLPIAATFSKITR